MKKNRSTISISFLMGLATAFFFTGNAHSEQYDRRTPIVEAVEKVLPAVVNISTSKTVSVNRSPFPRHFRTPFDEVFREQYKLQGLGSGVLIEGGYIITNNHVISYDEYKVGPADRIQVTIYNEKETREAVLIGANPDEDVAILKLKGFIPEHNLSWGRSDDLMIGETVIAAGSSLGQPFTVTTGIISALNRTIAVTQDRQYSNLIQTNADINQGNSGGPLVNINGEFIGLNTMILSPSGGSVGLGFAIPVSRVKKIFDYWVNGTISLQDQLGIEPQDLTPNIVRHFKQEYESLHEEKLSGVFIYKIPRIGPASNYLYPLDIILEINDHQIEDCADFYNQLEENKEKNIEFTIIRQGQKFPVSFHTPSNKIQTDTLSGMTLQELDNAWHRWFTLPDNFKGLVILSVKEGSQAENKGIRRGDVLVNLNNEIDLTSLDDLKAAKENLQHTENLSLIMYRHISKDDWRPQRIKLTNTDK